MASAVSSYSPSLGASSVGAGSLDELRSRDQPKARPSTWPGLNTLAGGEVTEDTGSINSNRHQYHLTTPDMVDIPNRVLDMREYLNNELRNGHCIGWRWHGKVIPSHK